MAELKNLDHRYVYRWSVPLNKPLHQRVVQLGIKPEHTRNWLRTFDPRAELSLNTKKALHSGDWRSLKEILTRMPSLQLVGRIGSGKTYLTQELIRNDKDHIYIVLDSHNEYVWLKQIQQITTDLEESCRVEIPKHARSSIPMFEMYRDLITANKYPAQYIFVVDEAFRYKEFGIKNLMAESRKFIKVLAVTQEVLADYAPSIRVKPYIEYKV